MSGWVKWEKDLETDPRFVRLVRQMRNARYAGVTQESNGSVLGVLPATVLVSLTMGCLMKFWAYADTHIRTDNTLDLGFADIDELVGISGFASSLPEDWLVNIDESHVELPGYQQHNGIAAKKAALAQKRMENKRTRERRNGSVTPVTHQRNGRVTGASLDQTRPDQTKTETIRKSDGSPVAGRERKDSRAPPRDQVQDDFENMARVQRAYPPFAGNQADWQLAERACLDRLAEGATWDELEAGAQRFAAFVAAGGRSGPQYVDLPSKFYGNGLWKQPWTPPATKAETRLIGNLDAAAEAKRQLFGDSNVGK